MVSRWHSEIRADRALAFAVAAFALVLSVGMSGKPADTVSHVDLVGGASALGLATVYGFAALFVCRDCAAKGMLRPCALIALLCVLAGGATAATLIDLRIMTSTVGFITASITALLVFRIYLNDEIKYV